MKRLAVAVLCASFLLSGPLTTADEPVKEINYYDLLSTDRVAAREFIRKHPDRDGRGVVIAILDTGVDMTVPGLTETSTGEPKVIEARDFSGQGIVHLDQPQEAMEGQEPVLKSGDIVVRGFPNLKPQPDKATLLAGVLEEKRFQSSSVSDVNWNGRTDDRFVVLAGKVDGNWGAWVDSDADGHVDDETMAVNFADSRQAFFFSAGAAQPDRKLLAVALQIEPDRREISFHFPDGSHGTHVAGIAAGYRLFGKKGFNGIAPGARIMSLKIGDNTLSGGSTTTGSMAKALQFAGSWSEQHSTPVVVNMSYGIGSEREGLSSIDFIVDDTLRRYPLLSVATSAGNSGAGLSTVGTPAGARLAFSTAALLTRENARTLYGTSLDQDEVFYFSSRGGELAKPDGLAPGCAASQVPRWENWIVMRGTSMASPQAAGCLALLAGAAWNNNPRLEVNGGLLARALRNSGKPLPGYTLADQGPGVIHVPTAWDSLRELASRDDAAKVAGFYVRSDSPSSVYGDTQTAYFRTGTYLPASPDKVVFSVAPMFMQNVTPEQKESYLETFDLIVESDWLDVDADSFFLRGASGASIDVFLRPDRLKEPGLHTARIRGIPRGVNRNLGSLFELWAVVVVPYVFDLTQGYHRSFADESVGPSEVNRYFLRVPEGAASMTIDVSPADGRLALGLLQLFDPEGHEVEVDQNALDSTRKRAAHVLVAKDDLLPGVWEVDVIGSLAAQGTSRYDLDVLFSGFSYLAADEIEYSAGASPRGAFEVRSVFDQVFKGRAQGTLAGLFREQELTATGDRFEFPVTLEKDVEQARLVLRFPPDVYARFTDVAVNVTDFQGQTLDKTGFTSGSLTIVISNPTAGTADSSFIVQMLAALAQESDEPWSFTVEEYLVSTRPIPVRVACDGLEHIVLFPNTPAVCVYELQDKPAIAPSGYLYFGDIRFRDERTRQDVLVIPLKLRVAE